MWIIQNLNSRLYGIVLMSTMAHQRSSKFPCSKGWRASQGSKHRYCSTLSKESLKWKNSHVYGKHISEQTCWWSHPTETWKGALFHIVLQSLSSRKPSQLRVAFVSTVFEPSAIYCLRHEAQDGQSMEKAHSSFWAEIFMRKMGSNLLHSLLVQRGLGQHERKPLNEESSPLWTACMIHSDSSLQWRFKEKHSFANSPLTLLTGMLCCLQKRRNCGMAGEILSKNWKN